MDITELLILSAWVCVVLVGSSVLTAGYAATRGRSLFLWGVFGFVVPVAAVLIVKSLPALCWMCEASTRTLWHGQWLCRECFIADRAAAVARSRRRRLDPKRDRAYDQIADMMDEAHAQTSENEP